MDPTTEEGQEAISGRGEREPTAGVNPTEKPNQKDVQSANLIKLNLRIR